MSYEQQLYFLNINLGNKDKGRKHESGMKYYGQFKFFFFSYRKNFKILFCEPTQLQERKDYKYI